MLIGIIILVKYHLLTHRYIENIDFNALSSKNNCHAEPVETFIDLVFNTSTSSV